MSAEQQFAIKFCVKNSIEYMVNAHGAAVWKKTAIYKWFKWFVPFHFQTE